MTFNELDRTLPNGFHDVELRHFSMDYVNRTLIFDLVVWIGRMEDEQARELYRPATVKFQRLPSWFLSRQTAIILGKKLERFVSIPAKAFQSRVPARSRIFQTELWSRGCISKR